MWCAAERRISAETIGRYARLALSIRALDRQIPVGRGWVNI
jgi:hypothetical protein